MINQAHRIITPPVLEPITLDKAKDFLRVDISDDDNDIEGFILAAREYCENDLGRALITQTIEYVADCFPYSGSIRLPMPPIQSIDHIKYLDSDGVLQTLDASKYVLDNVTEPARIVPAYGEVWPSIQQTINAVKIQFVAGYGDEPATKIDPGDIPGNLTLAMLMLMGFWYDNRQDEIIGSITQAVKRAYDSLARPHQTYSFY